MLNFCDDDLPTSVGYLCSRILPAATKPTTILDHGWLQPINHLWLREASFTQEHRPLILAEPPNLIEFTRFAITAYSHKVHSWGAAVCGYDEGEGCAPSNPAATLLMHPRVYVLAQGACRKPQIFPKICSTYLVIFTLGLFSERVVAFSS